MSPSRREFVAAGVADRAPAKRIWPACERTSPNTFVLYGGPDEAVKS